MSESTGPNTLGMIRDYLQRNGFDGLYLDDECGCRLDDLFPCGGEYIEDCKAGVVSPCDCGDHSWHIGPKKGINP